MYLYDFLKYDTVSDTIVALVLATTYAYKDTPVMVNRPTNDAIMNADHDPILDQKSTNVI